MFLTVLSGVDVKLSLSKAQVVGVKLGFTVILASLRESLLNLSPCELQDQFF